MNRERIAEVAAAIALDKPPREGLRFDMCTFADLRPCGSAGCIAGWAVAMYAPQRFELELYPHRKLREPQQRDLFEMAGELLDLDPAIASYLFLPADVDMERVTPKIASEVLLELLSSGKVVWPEEVFERDYDEDEEEDWS